MGFLHEETLARCCANSRSSLLLTSGRIAPVLPHPSPSPYLVDQLAAMAVGLVSVSIQVSSLEMVVVGVYAALPNTPLYERFGTMEIDGFQIGFWKSMTIFVVWLT